MKLSKSKKDKNVK